jgi:hypothetical protein
MIVSSEEQCAIATAETMPPLVLEELLNWKANAAVRAGVARDKVGLDPVFKDWHAVHLVRASCLAAVNRVDRLYG